MPTTDGYNGAYTGPEIDKGIARANQAVTVPGSGTASMSETLGSGPYTIEFTEEAGSGGGSLPYNIISCEDFSATKHATFVRKDFVISSPNLM